MKRALVVAYLALLALSHAWQRWHVGEARESDESMPGRVPVDVPAMDDEGPVSEANTHISLLHWPAGLHVEARSVPVLLLHGSPGAADNFDSLGPELARRGFDAWAIDLPGFGQSWGDVPSYSILAHARAALAALEKLGIERAHVVAWSMGGGVALHMADLAPRRVASVALLASIGAQAGEGSGSYDFEHLKYACLYAGLIVLPGLVPHFGWIGAERGRYSFVRNFWDTDQRPLSAILTRTSVPLLVVHGRDDFLVPVWCARLSHELASDSRLVVVEGSHFLPFTGAHGNAETVEELTAFLERHATPGVREVRASVDRVPPARAAGASWLAWDLEPFTLTRTIRWWLQVAFFGVSAWRARRATAVAAALLVAASQVDLGVALIAVAAGSACAGSSALERTKHVAGAIGWFVLASIAGGVATYFAPSGVARSWVLACVASCAALVALWFARRRAGLAPAVVG